MQYDIAYLRGHGNGDKGAIGNNRTEYDMCQDRVNRVVKYLQAGGMKVFTNSPSQNNFETNILQGIDLKYKFAITDHMNSADASATGVEIWIPIKEKNFTLEEKILKDLSKYLASRGVRKRNYYSGNWSFATDSYEGTDYYKEIRQSWNMGISHDIFEMGFISNFYDVKAIETYKDEIAKIIANDILVHFGFKKVKEDGYGTWKKDKYGWWYENKDGSYPVNQWLKLKDEWYYFDEKGYAYQNKWLKYKNEWYYFDNDCKMVTNKVFKIDEEGKMKI